MRIAIVDDQLIDRDNLKQLLPDCLLTLGFPISQLDTYTDGQELLANFSSGQYDLIFLDIYMNHLNGIETARGIRTTDTDVKLIFITSCNEFAAESYSVQADYYLLKPYTKPDLDRVLNHIHLETYEKNRVIQFPQEQWIPVHSIVYTSYYGHYETVHMKDGSTIRIRMSHGDCQKLLTSFSCFIACNKGMLANMEMIDRMEENGFTLITGEYIPVSRRRYNEVKTSYSQFLMQYLRQRR